MCLFCFGCGMCGKERSPEMEAFFNAPRRCIVCDVELAPDQDICPKCGREVPLAAGMAGAGTVDAEVADAEPAVVEAMGAGTSGRNQEPL